MELGGQLRAGLGAESVFAGEGGLELASWVGFGPRIRSRTTLPLNGPSGGWWDLRGEERWPKGGAQTLGLVQGL